MWGTPCNWPCKFSNDLFLLVFTNILIESFGRKFTHGCFRRNHWSRWSFVLELNPLFRLCWSRSICNTIKYYDHWLPTLWPLLFVLCTEWFRVHNILYTSYLVWTRSKNPNRLLTDSIFTCFLIKQQNEYLNQKFRNIVNRIKFWNDTNIQ